MIRPPRSIPLTSRPRAFTALEALVMLIALFILTMLGIGLWRKKVKEEKIETPVPAKAGGVIKSESPGTDKNSPAEKSKPPTTPGKPAPAIPDQNPPTKKTGSTQSPD